MQTKHRATHAAIVVYFIGLLSICAVTTSAVIYMAFKVAIG